MTSFISTQALRVLLFGALAAGGQFLTTACTKDTEDTKSYAGVDEDIIKKYLADKSITTAQRQPSGLYYLPVTANAAGTRAVPGKTVSVLYTGRFLDGRVFDSTSSRNNAPFTFVLGARQVITGWDEGIALMRKGEKAELLIPSAMAYGSRGSGASIPPNTVLRFEVELVEVR